MKMEQSFRLVGDGIKPTRLLFPKNATVPAPASLVRITASASSCVVTAPLPQPPPAAPPVPRTNNTTLIQFDSDSDDACTATCCRGNTGECESPSPASDSDDMGPSLPIGVTIEQGGPLLTSPLFGPGLDIEMPTFEWAHGIESDESSMDSVSSQPEGPERDTSDPYLDPRVFNIHSRSHKRKSRELDDAFAVPETPIHREKRLKEGETRARPSVSVVTPPDNRRNPKIVNTPTKQPLSPTPPLSPLLNNNPSQLDLMQASLNAMLESNMQLISFVRKLHGDLLEYRVESAKSLGHLERRITKALVALPVDPKYR